MAAMRKVTITLPESSVEAIRDLVADGTADSVSGFVQHAVAVSLDDVGGWRRMLAEALERTGGPLTPDEETWADGVLGVTSDVDQPSGAA